jgi:hypothetical protein
MNTSNPGSQKIRKAFNYRYLYDIHCGGVIVACQRSPDGGPDIGQFVEFRPMEVAK